MPKPAPRPDDEPGAPPAAVTGGGARASDEIRTDTKEMPASTLAGLTPKRAAHAAARPAKEALTKPRSAKDRRRAAASDAPASVEP